MRQSWETMTPVSAGHIILTPTQPVGSGRPQRESNLGPPHQESRALPTELPRPPKFVHQEPQKVGHKKIGSMLLTSRTTANKKNIQAINTNWYTNQCLRKKKICTQGKEITYPWFNSRLPVLSLKSYQQYPFFDCSTSQLKKKKFKKGNLHFPNLSGKLCTFHM